MVEANGSMVADSIPTAGSADGKPADHASERKVHTLVAKDIKRIYKDDTGHEVLALDGFEMHVEGPEVIGLVGPSGCGKSTFLRLLAGLDEAQGGILEYDGSPIEGPHYDRGLVFQSPTLFEWLTVHDNIAFGLKARGIYKENKHKVDDYIKMMGLEGFEKSYPYQISGGMASRCALARTFIQDPGMILLDEPLSALDAFTRMIIQDEIVRMHQHSDAIFVLVTHDIEEAVYLCDRVIVMSPRPGRTVGEVKLDMPHPRDRMSVDFVEARRSILDLLDSGSASPAMERLAQAEVDAEPDEVDGVKFGDR